MNTKQLNIAFDATWMDINNTIGGGFQYSERLIYALVKATNHNIIVIVGERGEEIFKELLYYYNFKLRILRGGINIFNIIRTEKIDLLYAPVQVYTAFLKSVPMVTTLHDLQHYHFPEFFTQDDLNYREISYKKVAYSSERIIVSYQHVKDDIVNFFKIDPRKIDVCPVGVDVPIELKFSEYAKVKSHYNLPDRFILYCANLWPHKNHMSLIRALTIIRGKYDYDISLVFTGKNDGVYEDQYLALIEVTKECGLVDHVKFVGYIPEEEKLLILKNSTLVAVPTLYEAGSFPLLEAMNYSIPVVCSNVTSLPSQIGDMRFVFNPNDIEDIADKIISLLTDNCLRDENIANSKRMIEDLRWENVVDSFLKSYNSAIIGYNEKNILRKLYNSAYDKSIYIIYPFIKKTIKKFKPLYRPILNMFGFYRWGNKILK